MSLHWHAVLLLISLELASALAPQPGPKRTEALWRTVLRVAGISATPAGVRSEGKGIEGELWLTTAAPKPSPRRVTTEGGYRSPVFELSGDTILALRRGRLARISVPDGRAEELLPLPDVVRLLGPDPAAGGDLLLLKRGSDGALSVGALQLRSGEITRIPHQPGSHDDVLIEYLKGSEREYRGIVLTVRRSEEETPAGFINSTDVFLRTPNQPRVNVSLCHGADCDQPALSPDGKTVVFVKSPPRP